MYVTRDIENLAEEKASIYCLKYNFEKFESIMRIRARIHKGERQESSLLNLEKKMLNVGTKEKDGRTQFFAYILPTPGR